jgi:hypothetical protein
MITTSMWPAVSTRHGWSSTISSQTALLCPASGVRRSEGPTIARIGLQVNSTR